MKRNDLKLVVDNSDREPSIVEQFDALAAAIAVCIAMAMITVPLLACHAAVQVISAWERGQ